MKSSLILGLRAVAAGCSLGSLGRLRIAIDGCDDVVEAGDVDLFRERVYSSQVGRWVDLKNVELLDCEVVEVLKNALCSWDENRSVSLNLQDASSFHDPGAAGNVTMFSFGDRGGVETQVPPMLYPPIAFDERFAALHGGAVVPIGRRRYRVTYSREAYGPSLSPQDVVVFEETFDDVTPFEILGLQYRKKWVAPYVVGRESLVWFGPPVFVQGTVLPALDGKADSLLLRLEGVWGDSGNENVFVSLDALGRPVRVCLEANCAPSILNL